MYSFKVIINKLVATFHLLALMIKIIIFMMNRTYNDFMKVAYAANKEL